MRIRTSPALRDGLLTVPTESASRGLLLIHGERDGLVALHHSQALFEAAQEPKALWTVEDAGHIGALRESKVRKRLAEFLRAPGAERLAELSDH